MALLVYTGFLLAAIYAISKSSDLLINAASGLGRQFHLKDYLIGSLIVGIGTSLPELVTSLAAIVQDEPVLVAPTIYGTIIANIGAGLGLAVVGLYVWLPTEGRLRLVNFKNPSSGGALNFDVVNRLDTSALPDTPIIFAVFSLIFSYFLCIDGTFSRVDALWFLLGYLAFILNEFSKRQPVARSAGPDEEPSTSTPVAKPAPAAVVRPPAQRQRASAYDALRVLGASYGAFLFFLIIPLAYVSPFERAGNLAIFLVGMLGLAVLQTVLYWDWSGRDASRSFTRYAETVMRRWHRGLLLACLALSVIVVFFSGVIIVESVIFVADSLGILSTVLAASVIAIGTSLPDIVVALKVARLGRHRLLIGHIIQSNVFDVFLITAICGLVQPLPIDAMTASYTIPFALALTFCLLLMVRDKKIDLTEGILLFLAMVIFIAGLFT